MWRGRESCVKWEGLGVLGQGKFKEREPPLGFKEPGMGVGQLVPDSAYILSLSPVLLDDHPGLELCERWRTKGPVPTGEKAAS